MAGLRAGEAVKKTTDFVEMMELKIVGGFAYIRGEHITEVAVRDAVKVYVGLALAGIGRPCYPGDGDEDGESHSGDDNRTPGVAMVTLDGKRGTVRNHACQRPPRRRQLFFFSEDDSDVDINVDDVENHG